MFCVRPSSYDELLPILFEKKSVTSQNLKIAKLWDWLVFRKSKMDKGPLPKISLLVQIGEEI